MGCGTSRKAAEIRPEQQWDAISLQDFKSTSCFTPFAFCYLYLTLITSVAVYGVDTFTAVNLIAFNKWSSSIEPTQRIPFDVLKWIFVACIIASFINLGFEHLRAARIMRRGSVAESFLDNLAVRLESVRFGSGRGWRRFLVFAELTKSKKGAEYVALFTYFSFQSWIRVLVCSGPRQLINALTLYTVFTSDLFPQDVSSVQNTLGEFFAKLQTLANENTQQVLILSGMLFTLIIWIFSALFLLTAALFYVFFLWHYIPRQDGGLHGYCERKINKRLMSIVTVKINKALAKEERDRIKADIKASKKTGEKPPMERQATIPSLMSADSDDKLPEMPMMSRSETMSTLPLYTSRPGTPNSIEMNAFDQKRPVPSRQGTSTSNYSTRAPLLSSAAGMGFDGPTSPAPTLPRPDTGSYQTPARSGAPNSNRSYGPGSQLSRAPTNGSGYTPQSNPYQSPQGSFDTSNRPTPRPINQLGGRLPNSPLYDGPGRSMSGRSSPAPSTYSNRGQQQQQQALPPMRSATNPVVSPRGPHFPPQRNMSGPPSSMHSRQGGDDYFSHQRPGTAASQRNIGPGPTPGSGYSTSDRYNPDLEGQRGYARY